MPVSRLVEVGQGSEVTQFKIQARHLTTRLKLKTIAERFIEKSHSESSIELVYKTKEDGYIFIFYFGSLVFVNVSEELQSAVLRKIVDGPIEQSFSTSEDFAVLEDSTLPVTQFHEMGFNAVKVRELTYPVMRLLALVIAESAALDYFENTAEGLLLESRRISVNLKKTGKPNMKLKDMMRFIGVCFTTKQEIISDLYVVDAPDETWEDQVLARLYDDMKRLFEIEARYKILHFKLQLVHETVDVIVDLLRFQRQTFLEIVIIVLILLEVIWLGAQYVVGK